MKQSTWAWPPRETTKKMFGGTVQTDSIVGQGSVFRVTLPIPLQRPGAPDQPR